MTTTIDDILIGRRKRVQNICKQIGGVTNRTSQLSSIKSANMSYCAVQKASCTMWIRLIKFMDGQNKETGNPMTLTKYLIHNKGQQFHKKIKMKGPDAIFISRSLRVMTVRDPFTRLWSAYIDKFLLLDFWSSKGKQIIEMTRKHPKPLSTRCGHDVTFPEFIQYVIKIGHQFTYLDQDKHWLPASDICDPCAFNPHIIGKQETFMADMKYTLKKIKLDYLFHEMNSIPSVEFEIKDVIDYNFKIYSNFKSCIDIYGLCKRLWTAFILNGYIPSEESFPTNIYQDSLNVESFYGLVKDIRTKYNITRATTKEKRRQALETAYKQIPANHKEELQKLYKMDFELFGYNSDPDFLH